MAAKSIEGGAMRIDLSQRVSHSTVVGPQHLRLTSASGNDHQRPRLAGGEAIADVQRGHPAVLPLSDNFNAGRGGRRWWPKDTKARAISTSLMPGRRCWRVLVGMGLRLSNRG